MARDDENHQATSIFSSVSYRFIEGKQVAGFPFVGVLCWKKEGTLDAGADEGTGVRSVWARKLRIDSRRTGSLTQVK